LNWRVDNPQRFEEPHFAKQSLSARHAALSVAMLVHLQQAIL
jgi:hypothetical protein